MFENRSHKQILFIYATIAITASLCLAVLHYLQGFHPYYIIAAVNIEFFCIFYILYLPVKVRRDREKQEKKKSKK